MGGTISVQSIAGKGTTVRVEMSCAQAWKSRWEASIKGDATPAANKATVLVIDDDPLVGDAIGLTLGDAQEVTVVSSGREALDRLLRGEHFDVILCDILMPMMTGMDLYAELVAVEPGAANSMIFMTGGATSARARTFIATPTPAAAGVDEVHRLLGWRSGHQAAQEEGTDGSSSSTIAAVGISESASRQRRGK
jgi:CheY-like chemotaxis protein